MVKRSAHRNSAFAVMTAAKKIKATCNKTWNLAPKAPMFTRKTKTTAGKKKLVRTKRLINGHAYKICASGAAGYVNAVMQRESNAFRTTIGTESKRTPWLPTISKGAIALIEQFLCAYAQEGTRNAVSIRQGLGRKNQADERVDLFKRLNGKLMKFGFDTADASIFRSAMPAPRALMVCKVDKKTVTKKTGKTEECEFEPVETV